MAGQGGQWPRASPPARPHWQSGPVSYPKLHLPLRTLQKLFQEQLRVELATTVAVESVEKARVLTKEVLQAVRTLAGSHPWSGRAGRAPAHEGKLVGLLLRRGPLSPPP